MVGTVSATGVVIPRPKNINRRVYDATVFVAQRRRIPSTLHYEGKLTPTHLLKKEVLNNFICSCKLFIHFFLKGFYALEPFVTVEVPQYTKKEASNCFEYYKDRNWIQNPLAREDDGREEFIFLSGCNPAEFMRVCAPI